MSLSVLGFCFIFAVSNIIINTFVDMQPANKYQIIDESTNVVSEPAVVYGTVMDPSKKEPAYLSEDIIVEAAKYASVASKEGRMIPNNQIHSLLAERLGW